MLHFIRLLISTQRCHSHHISFICICYINQMNPYILLGSRKIIVVDGMAYYCSTGTNSDAANVWFPFVFAAEGGTLERDNCKKPYDSILDEVDISLLREQNQEQFAEKGYFIKYSAYLISSPCYTSSTLKDIYTRMPKKENLEVSWQLDRTALIAWYQGLISWYKQINETKKLPDYYRRKYDLAEDEQYEEKYKNFEITLQKEYEDLKSRNSMPRIHLAPHPEIILSEEDPVIPTAMKINDWLIKQGAKMPRLLLPLYNRPERLLARREDNRLPELLAILHNFIDQKSSTNKTMLKFFRKNDSELMLAKVLYNQIADIKKTRLTSEDIEKCGQGELGNLLFMWKNKEKDKILDFFVPGC